jgi:hypothetical protein
MPIVVFTYFCEGSSDRKFGKYVVSDISAKVGIDVTIKKALKKWFGIRKCTLGIVSFTQDNAWTTYREVHAFDVYIEKHINGTVYLWQNGDPLHVLY